MKRIFILLLYLSSSSVFAKLPDVTENIDIYHEIAIVHQSDLPSLYNKLTPQERIFLYYMYRASLPGNRICADQLHRAAVEITETFEDIYLNRNKLLKSSFLDFDITAFIEQIKTYLVYLWTNHSQYFMKEHIEDKRTPEILGLTLLTKKNIAATLQLLDYDDPDLIVDRLVPFIFQKNSEHTCSVAGSIDESSMNLYAPDFTDEDFQKLSLNDQSRLNSYCYLEVEKGKRLPKIMVAKVGGKYDAELSVSLFWLQKALDHVRCFPEQFDQHFVASLEYLCEFIKTGDEELFKKHSIAWLKSNSRIDYNFGFVENYLDPKAYRGLFQADITIKSLDMEKVNNLLPMLEAQLPFSAEFKRDNLMEGGASCPNASINTKVFTAGLLGPLNLVQAYCLPNYEEIRSTYGSKQIIYPVDKRIGEKINPQLFNKLFHLPEDNALADQYDPDYQLQRDIFMLHVILHETLGHGSGKCAKHTFVEGDPMVIDGKSYNVGDEIAVTSANEQVFLGEYRAALEELRAEIIALFSSTANYEDFARSGLLGQWPEKIEKETLIRVMIKDMCELAFGRWLTVSEKTGKVSGAHSLANTTILYYLVDRGGVAIVEEPVMYKNKTHTVLGIRIISKHKTLAAIKELACLVQKIKSTADGIGVKKLFETYGIQVRNLNHIALLKNNMKLVTGDVKISASLFPRFVPVYDDKEMVDIDATWPNDFFEQHLEQKKLMFSRE